MSECCWENRINPPFHTYNCYRTRIEELECKLTAEHGRDMWKQAIFECDDCRARAVHTGTHKVCSRHENVLALYREALVKIDEQVTFSLIRLAKGRTLDKANDLDPISAIAREALKPKGTKDR